MTTVFLLVLYFGGVPQQSNMMFYDINRCQYFAHRIMRQAPEPRTGRKYVALCRPVDIDINNSNNRIYR
tara:strand:+ start:40 stop:246 length:207 start_codon:yes stop_codon:yes gene_type:complete